MREIGVALLFIMAVNLFLFSAQMSMDEMATLSGETVTTNFYNYNGSVLQNFDSGDYVVTQNVTGELPTGTGDIETDSGNIFTDTFVILREWFTGTTGGKFITAIVSAFPNTIKQLGLPVELAFALGALWHAVTLLLVIMFLRGY